MTWLPRESLAARRKIRFKSNAGLRRIRPDRACCPSTTGDTRSRGASAA